jgi:hypothetical protein
VRTSSGSFFGGDDDVELEPRRCGGLKHSLLSALSAGKGVEEGAESAMKSN